MIFKILLVIVLNTILLSQTNNIVTIDAKSLIEKIEKIELKNKEVIQNLQSDDTSFIFNINHKIIESICINQTKEFKILNFPVSPTILKNVILEKDIIPVDENTIWLRNTKAGILKGESPKFNFYSGKIEGEDKSKIYFGYSDGKLFCIIERDNGEKYYINPLPEEVNSEKPHILVASNIIYEKSELMPFICFTKDYSNIPTENEIKNKLKNQLQSDKMLQLEIALEGAYDYFQLHATYEKASAYMTAVMTIVSKIYYDQLNVKIHIPYVMIYEDASKDPYANRDDVGQKLWRMPNAWKNRSNIQRTIACLFAGLHPNGSYYTAGISMGINTLCDKQRGYCVFGILGSSALPTMNYVTDVSVTAHEIGHACGGPHTHSCYFEPNMIDTCITAHLPNESDGCVEDGLPIPHPGTIMSYCHLTNSTRTVEYIFGDRMTPLLRSALDEANCISEVKEPVIALLNPSGDKSLKSGSKEEIIWTSTLINLVSIKYSSDNGKSWNNIASGKPASDKSFVWTVPYINADKVIIVIYDTGNSEIADTVLKPFSIRIPILKINGPTEGQRFGQKEKYNITWETLFIDTVNILFSSNGGTNWTTVANNIKGKKFEWEVPQISSSNCKIKVESLTEDKLISESGLFGIGTSSAKLISPSSGEKLCVGADFEIRWESDYINNFWLEYSTDNGTVWRKVSLGLIDANKGYYNWRVPNRISDSCILRIFPQFDKNLILDVSDSAFTIDSCQSGIGNDYITTGIKIMEVNPNPVNDEAEITLNYYSNSHILSLILFDNNGREVRNIGNYESLQHGKISIKIKLGDLSQGNYFIKANSGIQNDVHSIKIVR